MTSEDTSPTFDSMHQAVADGKPEPSLPVLPNAPQDVPSDSGAGTTLPSTLHNITDAHPPRLAYLRLISTGKDTYTFSVNPDLQVGKIPSYPKPPPNLIDHLGGGMAIDARDSFLEEVYHVSEIGQQLRKWLKRLYKQQTDTDRWMIVIEDNLGIPFPWEFFAFNDPDDQEGKMRHMGAEFVVTRWQDLDYDDDDGTKDLSPLAREKTVKGDILAYFSSDILARERPFLEDLDADLLDDIEDFKTALLMNQTGLGLVYVGCYTALGDELKRDWIKIGHMKDIRQQISLSKLRYRPGHGRLFLKRIQCSKPIVFLNACFTALSRPYAVEINQIEMSFPRVFLENDANGVIATLGLVDNKHFAPQIAEAIIEAVKGGTSVAEALQQARRRAFEALPKGRDVTHDELKELFNAFMYVYYGNPETTLEVSGR